MATNALKQTFAMLQINFASSSMFFRIKLYEIRYGNNITSEVRGKSAL